MNPKVSVVCVTYTRRDLVLKCLKSCIEQDYPSLEILVVVNPSGDGTEEAIQQTFPEIRILRTHTNIGFFPALNLAIANTSGDYIMAVDDDAYFLKMDAITNLVNAFREEPRLGAVTCSLEGPHEVPTEGADRYISVFTTGFTMVPRQVYTHWAGYFPDIFFRSAGETYVCTRLWELGRPVKRLHNVRMYHERAWQGRSDRDWKFYGLKSQILCAFMRDPWYFLPFHLCSKGVRSLFQSIGWGHAGTWAQAWIGAFYHLPEALKLRQPIHWRTQRLLWRLRKEMIRSPLPSFIPPKSMMSANKS